MENDSITTSPTDVATAAMLHAVATDKAPAYTISAQSRAASVTPLATAAATAAANVLTLQHSESGLKTYAVVRKHGVNGGFDTKFDTHTYPAGLHALVPYDEYQALIEEVNEVGRQNRASRCTIVLLYCLVCCPLLCEKKGNSKARKEEYKAIFNAFTARHPRLRVRIKTSGELVVEDNPAVLYTGPPATPFITPAV